MNKIQRLRKDTGISLGDDIIVVYNIENAPKLGHVCETLKDNIVKVLKVPFTKDIPENYKEHAKTEAELGEEKEKVVLTIYRKY